MADLAIPTGFGLWQFYMTHATIAHTAITTLGFEVLTPPYDQTDCDNALATFAAAVTALHDSEVTYAKVVALLGNDGPLLRFESAGVAQGTRSAVTIAPPNVSYLLKKTTGFAGRRYRGRMYIPFVANVGTAQTGQLTAPELTILTARAAALETNMVSVFMNTASLSLLHAESALSATPDPTPILSINAENYVATQRRRLERS